MERIEQQIKTALDELDYKKFEFVGDGINAVFIPLGTHIINTEVEDEIAAYAESHCDLIVVNAEYSNLADGDDRQGIFLTFEEVEVV